LILQAIKGEFIMEKTICPKCQSKEFIRVPVFFKVGAYPVYFTIENGDKPIVLHPKPQVCRKCGYVEMYLPDEDLVELEGIPEQEDNPAKVD
jgi:predicted nucleic-acid-binding Zn-ribbon protein